MHLMSEIVGQKGVYPFLNKMYEIADVVKSLELGQLIEEANISQNLFSDLTKTGLFIGTPQGFYISSIGKKVTLLLRGINEDIENTELFNRLTYLDPSLRPYELITHDVTNYFIDSLNRSPDFIRVCICSPWIRLDETQLYKLQTALLKSIKIYPNLKISVITKPKKEYEDWDSAVEAFEILIQFGAEIKTNSKLHTKLYISEPGPHGGSHYAILGSENLTGKRNIELAIRIQNDNEILRKLNQYFFKVSEKSKILKGV